MRRQQPLGPGGYSAAVGGEGRRPRGPVQLL